MSNTTGSSRKSKTVSEPSPRSANVYTTVSRRCRGFDGRRIGVVTGVSMAPLMPPLLEQLQRATGAQFTLLVAENSLFGPTTTTAGLLVGADIRRALAGRTDLDLALIPAECINDDGLFLDEESFIALRESLPTAGVSVLRFH